MRYRGFFNILLIVVCAFAPGPIFTSAAAAESGRPDYRVRAFILRGQAFYDDKDYASAIKTWSKVLDMDPLNEEVGELIEDAKFQSDYQVAVLDRLSAASRIRTSKSAELDRLAKEMTQMLARAQTEKDEVLDRKVSSVDEKEAARYASELLAASERFAVAQAGPLKAPDQAAASIEPKRTAKGLPVFKGGDSVRIGMRAEVVAPAAALSNVPSVTAVPVPKSESAERFKTGALVLVLMALCVAAASMIHRRRSGFMFIPPRGPLKGAAKTFDPRTLRKHLGRGGDGARKERGLMD